MLGNVELSEQLDRYVDEKVREASAKLEDQRLTLEEKDPYGIYSIMPKDSKGEFTKSAEGRDYQKMIDMSHRIREWLSCNGTFRDKAGKAIKMSIDDAAHSKDMHLLFPKVTANVVIEHAEPMSNLLNLYEKVRFTNGTQITFPVWSPGGSSINLYMPETGEPNELTGDLSSFITATTGKVGIKTSVTEDTMRFSIIDLFALQLKWAGIALGRFKEKLAVDNLFNAASKNVLFDNEQTVVSSILGRTNGRASGGQRNGTISAFDLYDAYAHGMAQGSDLNTIIIHPLGWRALANNSVVRDRAYTNGGPVWNKASGSVGRGNSGGGARNIFKPNWPTQQVGATEIATQAMTMAGVANIFGQPFNVITSPFAPIRKAATVTSGGGTTVQVKNKYVCDILMIDVRDVGVHVVDQELYSRTEERIFQQIKETALFERYGFGSSNQGSGLFIMKSIVAAEGYDFESTPIVRQITGLDDGGNTYITVT